MGAELTGFRVFGRRGEGAGRSPRAVAYRLDPRTLDYVDLFGDAEELLGFPPEQWRRPGFWYERLHPEDRPAARAFCRSWTQDRQSHQEQYRLVHASGRVLWMHDIVEVSGRGAGQEIRGIMLDLTGRPAREPAGRPAARLQEQLLRITAEELTRPVRDISACAELLERHLSIQRDDVGSDHAIGIRDGVQRLHAVLSELRHIAKSGEMTVEQITDSLAAIRGEGRAGG